MNMRLFLFGFIFLTVIFPWRVFAGVIINEIAWMGTETSVNDEWLELYNTDDSPSDLDGWILRAADGSPSISLSGTVSAGGYFLLERSDDRVVSSPADLIYTGALGNDGEILELVDELGTVVDLVSFPDGWSAGDNASKETMAWNGSAWVTTAPSPGAENIITSTGDATGGEETVSAPKTASSGSKEEKKEPVYKSSMTWPKNVVAGVAAEFHGLVERDDEVEFKGVYTWSFGDGGYNAEHKKSTKAFGVSHTYEYPGSYVIVFEYYDNIFIDKSDPVISERKTVTVIDGVVGIKSLAEGDITIVNNAPNEINLGGWYLRDGYNIFPIPPNTIIMKGAEITLPRTITRLPKDSIEVELLLPNESFVASYNSMTAPAREVVATSEPSTAKITKMAEAYVEKPKTASVIRLEDKNKVPWVPIGLAVFISIISIIISFKKWKEAQQRKESFDDESLDIQILEDE